jgi:hypothetical protein
MIEKWLNCNKILVSCIQVSLRKAFLKMGDGSLFWINLTYPKVLAFLQL